MHHNKVLIIVGPTAVGKTALSIRIAERFNGEIISADSRLLYQGMNIGTAKPTAEEMSRVPHHMIDLANPDEIWSLAQYQAEVLSTIYKVQSRQHLPIIVGGTGQYIRSLTEGWVIPAQEPDQKLREVLELWAGEIGAEELHHKLSLIDPEAARKIDVNNIRRSIRAFEVIFRTGKLFSTQKEKNPPSLDFKIIGLNRNRTLLYQRIDERIETMFFLGLVDEVKGILERGYSPDLPSLSAIGYHEIIDYLQDKITLEEAKMLIKRKTRQYVRRQANWFKPSDSNIEWFDMEMDPVDRIFLSIDRWVCDHS